MSVRGLVIVCGLLVSGAAHADSQSRERLWPTYVGVGVAITGVLVGVFATVDALENADRADGLYASDPRFVNAHRAFARDRAFAITAFSVAAAAAGFATYWTIRRTSHTRIVMGMSDGLPMLALEHRR